jgi:hypothetical protein
MKRVRPPLPSAAPSPFDEAAPLSPFIIRRLAGRKGFFVDTIMKGKGGRPFVRLADARGEPIATPCRFGFTLAEAKRYLEQLPDRSRRATCKGGHRRRLPGR